MSNGPSGRFVNYNLSYSYAGIMKISSNHVTQLKFEAFVLSSAHNEELQLSTQPIFLSQKDGKKKNSILSGLTIQGRNFLAQ